MTTASNPQVKTTAKPDNFLKSAQVPSFSDSNQPKLYLTLIGYYGFGTSRSNHYETCFKQFLNLNTFDFFFRSIKRNGGGDQAGRLAPGHDHGASKPIGSPRGNRNAMESAAPPGAKVIRKGGVRGLMTQVVRPPSQR